MAKTKKTTGHYEILYIISNKFAENELDPINKSIKKIISTHKGVITYEEVWGSKKFAFPINHFTHGYYFLLELDSNGENINKIDRELRLHREILRHMIVVKEKRTDEEIKADKIKELELAKDVKNDKKEEKGTPKVEIVKEVKKEEKEKIDLKDLDDKLDKILDTNDLF